MNIPLALHEFSASLILATHVNMRLAFSPKANPERHRLAAHLAILDVLLVPRGSVDRDLKQLTTVGAADVSGFRRVHRFILLRKRRRSECDSPDQLGGTS